jgi:hypothetical protein
MQPRIARHGVHGQAGDGQAAGLQARVLRQRLHAAQQGLDARHQLQYRKRLGQVVVRADLQTQDAVHLAGAGADDDDGGVAGHGAGAAADLQPVHAREHDVQHQRVPGAALQFTQAVVAARAVHDLQAFVAQVQREQVGDMGVVLDEKYAARGGHGMRFPGKAICLTLCAIPGPAVITNL